jgi:tripartite-type tricarboxylate transporter receptor subunit TctC
MTMGCRREAAVIAKQMLLSGFLAAAVGSSSTIDATAQSYPQRTITLVVPLTAGGGPDVLCRVVAEKLRSILGQQVIVENRVGAGGNIGAESVARAAPDGHMLLCSPSTIFTNHLLYSKLSFDPRAFEPVNVFVTIWMVVFSRADLPAGNIADVLALARAQPGKLNWASPGIGTFSHLILEALKATGNVDMVHVPYRLSSQAFTDMLAGQNDLFAGALATVISHIQAGKMKVLAVTSRDRLANFSNVPALTETVPGLIAEDWIAIAAPPGTPMEVRATLSDAISKIVALPEVRARFSELQAAPLGTTPAQMREILRRTTEQWAGIIAKAKISLD